MLLQFRDPKSDWARRFSTLKAEIYVWQGLYKEALLLLQPELPASLSKSDTGIWRLMTQGSAYTALSQYEQAGQCLEKAKALAQANHSALLGQVLLRQGTLEDYRRNYDPAASLYYDALQFSLQNRDSHLQASALGSLGVLATEREHYDESIDWDRQALQVAEAIGAQSLAATIDVNLGWCYFEVGDYQQALSLFQQAEQSSRKSGLINLQLISRVNSGAVEYFLRDYPAAESDSVLALNLAQKLDDKERLTQSLNTLSDVALERGQLQAAENYNRQALEVSRSFNYHQGEISSWLITGRTEFGSGHYRQAQEYLLRIIRDASASTASRWEAQARLANVYAAQGALLKAQKEYLHAFDTVDTARDSIQQDELRLTFLSNAADFYDDYVDFLMRHGKAADALIFADLTRSRTLAEGLASSGKVARDSALRLHPQQIAEKLHATLLLYWIGQTHSYLWVVTPNKFACFPLQPGPEIVPLVRAYNRAISNGRDVLTSNAELGQQLYAMLVGPAEKLIAKNARVILLPGENLYGLNFETLIIPRPNLHFWIEDVTLSTASSLTLLSAARARIDQERNLLLVGNPEPPNADFPTLAQAPAEMQKVAAHFPQAQCSILQRKDATATGYLQSNPGQFSYLHFVTHGTASETHPLESAIILSKEGDSYKLYAREIVRHPLKAQLVTISACNGAGTGAYVGEGLVGLAWAFLRAGARNVIASVWEVSDASSTGQLMDALYGGLDRGEDPATALRKAKLLILKSNDTTVFHKPFYWAPFQLYIGS
jgi:CHAT domain-containing protein